MTKQKFLLQFVLRLADNTLILGHRLSQWCGHGPELEQDIALINISLDLIGQARMYYNYASKIENNEKTENYYAFNRQEREFHNLLLCELDNGHWGKTILRSLFFDVYHYLLLEKLSNSKNEQISAIALKSIKEVAYHVKFTSEWTIRLGDGTEQSHLKMKEALSELWLYTGEMFEIDEVERNLISNGIIPEINDIKKKWQVKISDVLQEATLEMPTSLGFQTGGKSKGIHTEKLGHLLSEMQYLPRCYPDAKW